MKEISDFLVNNWQYFLIVLAAFLDIIVLIKCKNKTVVYDDSLTSLVVDLVSVAEAEFGSGHGTEKLKFVIDRVKKDPKFSKVPEKIIQAFIETVLSTPQRKA